MINVKPSMITDRSMQRMATEEAESDKAKIKLTNPEFDL